MVEVHYTNLKKCIVFIKRTHLPLADAFLIQFHLWLFLSLLTTSF